MGTHGKCFTLSSEVPSGYYHVMYGIKLKKEILLILKNISKKVLYILKQINRLRGHGFFVTIRDIARWNIMGCRAPRGPPVLMISFCLLTVVATSSYRA